MKSKLIKLRLYRVYFKNGYRSNRTVFKTFNYQKNSKGINLAGFIKVDYNKDNERYIAISGRNIKDVIDQLIEIKNAIKEIIEVNNCICKVIREG